MVKVKIPFNTPVDDDDDGEKGSDEEVGIMSDIEESDVDDEIGDPDWEEVKGEDEEESFSFKPGKMPTLPENGVTINIDRPRRGRRGRSGKAESDDEADSVEEKVVKKKKRTVDLNEMVRKGINRVKITEQLMKHKLSLLIYLARGLRLIKIINCNIVRGLSLSLVGARFRMKSRIGTRKFLESYMEQFSNVVIISDDDDKRDQHATQPFMLNLLDCFATSETTSLMELVVIFVSCLKALKPDIPVRIVNVLRPITLIADIIPKPTANGEPVVKKVESMAQSEVVERLDFWVEVYIEEEKKWSCIDLCNLRIDEPDVLTELARPFSYLVSYDVDRHCVKPAEKNYFENWYSASFKKNRCEDKWWNSVMEALGPVKKSDRDVADETKTEKMLIEQKMPTSDNGFRRHPLYVLEKHLLKFEGIYPPEVPPIDFFKGSPIYPRDCVHTLRSRETWLRQAKTVKLDEVPYKTVKARPKWDKYSGSLVRDLPLELFGEWQVQDYDPPSAKGGQVPRNCYGNVDMYQPSMLPKGCVWLKLPALQRVANKLGIDCASAVVGFDNHCGSYGAHPVIDGFIVCQEHAETLQMAWEEEQVNIAKKEEEKRSKRIWDNWKRLLKAAMIREKLRVKYKNS